MKIQGKYFFAAVVLMVFGASFAKDQLSAQTAPGDPASRDATIPEKEVSKPLEPDQGTSVQGLETGRSESLSDRLDQSNGVITPRKGIDPGINKSVPLSDSKSSPVIKPAPDVNAK